MNCRFLFSRNSIYWNICKRVLNPPTTKKTSIALKVSPNVVFCLHSYCILNKLLFSFTPALMQLTVILKQQCFYIFMCSGVLRYKIEGEKGKKEMSKIMSEGQVWKCYFIFLWAQIYHLWRSCGSFPQCRLRTLRPCSTEAACERPRSESVLRLKEEKGEFSLSQTPTQMLTISIT